MKIRTTAMSRFFLMVVVALALMPQHIVLAQSPFGDFPGKPDQSSFPNMTMTPATLGDMMRKSKSCAAHNWNMIDPDVCCLKCHHSCCPGMKAKWVQIDYWEPSEIIEVSCRTGYSMLSPGSVPVRGGGNELNRALQSCQGFNKPGNSRWFFEARVWAINGYKGGLRHQSAMGGTLGEQVRQCTMEGDDVPWGQYSGGKYWGYGIKWNKFSRGSANGPAGSWEAYMSDKDPNWANDTGGASSASSQKECKPNTVDMENCWGPNGRTGWVSHPNPKIAAALVAWRAHTQSKGRVSPADGKGYKMALEYPPSKPTSPYASSMGVSGSKDGSECFTPGHSGPEWWGGMDPTAVPAAIKALKPGDMTTASEINPGVYIFTVWVHTSCMRFGGMKFPTPICHYMNGT